MVRVETGSGRFLETNQRFRELCGYSNSELNEMNFKEISHPSEIDKNLVLMQKLLKGEIREYSLEKRLVQKSGTVIWVKLSVSPLWKKDKKGKATYSSPAIQKIGGYSE